MSDTDAHSGLVSKGLASGKVGTFSVAVLGISSVAPGYTLTASIGLIVASSWSSTESLASGTDISVGLSPTRD